MIDYKHKYIKYKNKYLNLQLGSSQLDETNYYDNLEDFINYQFPYQNPRKDRMKSFLEEIINIGKEPNTTMKLSFINVRGDGLCFFSSIIEWYKRFSDIEINKEQLLEYISDSYKNEIVEKLKDIGFNPNTDEEITRDANMVGLSYPMDPDAPELEILIKLIVNFLQINIVIITYKAYEDSKYRKVCLYERGNSNIRTIFMYNTGGHISLMIPKIISSGGTEYSNFYSSNIFLNNLLNYNDNHMGFLDVDIVKN
jgi:hypothetical protein